MSSTVYWETVKRVKDADGAMCKSCKAQFWHGSNPYWGFRQSQSRSAGHENGTGHAMRLVKLIFANERTQ